MEWTFKGHGSLKHDVSFLSPHGTLAFPFFLLPKNQWVCLSAEFLLLLFFLSVSTTYTAQTCNKLIHAACFFFFFTPYFWLNIQNLYVLEFYKNHLPRCCVPQFWLPLQDPVMDGPPTGGPVCRGQWVVWGAAVHQARRNTGPGRPGVFDFLFQTIVSWLFSLFDFILQS